MTMIFEPVNPNMGRRYTKAEWIAAEEKMLQTTVAAMPAGKVIFMNGLGPGTWYWSELESVSPRPLFVTYKGPCLSRVRYPDRLRDG